MRNCLRSMGAPISAAVRSRIVRPRWPDETIRANVRAASGVCRSKGATVTTLLRDLRFGFRLLTKDPGFAAVAVAALALGIAANTAMFSVIYPTYFEPLPYHDAERLAMVWSQRNGDRIPVSPSDYRDWKRAANAFEGLNAWYGGEVNLAAGGERPELLTVNYATPGFLAMLGYGQPVVVGRNFVEDEATP